MQEQLVQLICDRLRGQFDWLHAQFSDANQENGVRYAVLDDLLPESIARNSYAISPAVDVIHVMGSFSEQYKSLHK